MAASLVRLSEIVHNHYPSHHQQRHPQMPPSSSSPSRFKEQHHAEANGTPPNGVAEGEGEGKGGGAKALAGYLLQLLQLQLQRLPADVLAAVLGAAAALKAEAVGGPRWVWMFYPLTSWMDGWMDELMYVMLLALCIQCTKSASCILYLTALFPPLPSPPTSYLGGSWIEAAMRAVLRSMLWMKPG